MGDKSGKTSRRGFFRQALAEGLEPLLELVTQDDRSGSSGVARADGRAAEADLSTDRLLRPPGAIPDPAFAEACHRCGACIEACPADAIFSWVYGAEVSGGNSPGNGTPVLRANRGACVVCDGLQCTHVCPSGALLPVHSSADINMGLAVVDQDLCVRASGEDCRLCVERCPLGHEAIELGTDDFPAILESGCVGCGVCEFACPTVPEAIRIVPAGSVRREDS